MPKATVQDIKNDGWRSPQFGGGFADDAAFDAYLASVLAEAGNWASAAVGPAVYAALAAGWTHDCIKRAELYHVAATLWKRRAVFADSAGTTSLQQGQYLERREYLTHAQQAMDCARAALGDALRALGIPADVLSDAPAMSIGHVETGPWPPTSREAIGG